MRISGLDLDFPDSEELVSEIACLVDDPDMSDAELREELRAMLFDDERE